MVLSLPRPRFDNCQETLEFPQCGINKAVIVINFCPLSDLRHLSQNDITLLFMPQP